MAGLWFSQDTPVSYNKTDRHDITEILLNVALNTITHPPIQNIKVKEKIPCTTCESLSK
jgi:hypothetical protein